MSAVKWPDGKKCAVTLTFDCDFETIWLAMDPSNIRRPGTVSQGTYEAKVGLPKVLEALKAEGAPGTFFVPGWVADNRPALVEAIIKGDHEVGHHSYWHRFIDPQSPDKEAEDLDKGIEAIRKILGKAPIGYRAAFGEISQNVIKLLADRGFLYDSSMQDDILPYRYAGSDGKPGVVELPWHRSIADAPYMLPTATQSRPIMTNEHVFSIWKGEFDAAYEAGGYFDILLHPQVIGRPSRVKLLREFIAYMNRHDGVWMATCTDVANAWLAQAPKDAKAPAYSPFFKEEADGRIVQV